MQLLIGSLERFPRATNDVEIVERKGLGHPDTVRDAPARGEWRPPGDLPEPAAPEEMPEDQPDAPSESPPEEAPPGPSEVPGPPPREE